MYDEVFVAFDFNVIIVCSNIHFAAIGGGVMVYVIATFTPVTP